MQKRRLDPCCQNFVENCCFSYRLKRLFALFRTRPSNRAWQQVWPLQFCIFASFSGGGSGTASNLLSLLLPSSSC